VSEQTIDDFDVAVLSGPHKGAVHISVDRQLAGFEHALHIRQSTMSSVITECLKV
jgi:heme-binding NEAT domain protein